MSLQSSTIVQRVWNYCNVLRDDGISYGDYVEQLTYLIFLKMDDENARFGRPSTIPEDLRWRTLFKKGGELLDGEPLEAHYIHILTTLGKQPGLIGVIFRKAQNRIQNPARLRRLIDLIDSENWGGLDVDIKSEIYEGLLEKNAQDVKGGAGQYFTPRALIKAMVEVMRPRPGDTIADPAAGTGGFLLAAYDYIAEHYRPLDYDQWGHLRRKALHGWEIVDNTARLCVMNLYLHGIGGDTGGDEGACRGVDVRADGVRPAPADSPIRVEDSLAKKPGRSFSMVLSNPPFGKKSSITTVTDAGEARRESTVVERDDFWASTSNKQLNFVQHIVKMLEINGRAAVVVPDNVLFEGGAGETIRRNLLQECDLHTLLRLPTGIFYAQGVKANVLFFDRRTGGETAATKELWIYDLRTNRNFTLKTNTLQREDLDDFVACYHPGNRHERQPTWNETNPGLSQAGGRWRVFTYDELISRDKVNLDIFWLRDESLEDAANLPDPEVIAAEIVEDLRAALEQFEGVAGELDEPGD